jgi:hypothetical protein
VEEAAFKFTDSPSQITAAAAVAKTRSQAVAFTAAVQQLQRMAQRAEQQEEDEEAVVEGYRCGRRMPIDLFSDTEGEGFAAAINAGGVNRALTEAGVSAKEAAQYVRMLRTFLVAGIEATAARLHGRRCTDQWAAKGNDLRVRAIRAVSVVYGPGEPWGDCTGLTHMQQPGGLAHDHGRRAGTAPAATSGHETVQIAHVSGLHVVTTSFYKVVESESAENGDDGDDEDGDGGEDGKDSDNMVRTVRTAMMVRTGEDGKDDDGCKCSDDRKPTCPGTDAHAHTALPLATDYFVFQDPRPQAGSLGRLAYLMAMGAGGIPSDGDQPTEGE